MKLALFVITLLIIVNGNAAVKTWVGASGATWSVSSNWNGGTPTSADDIVFNSNATITLDINTTVKSITLTTGTSVIINPNGARTLNLDNGAAGTPVLDIPLGATLTLGSGANTIILNTYTLGNNIVTINGTLVLNALNSSWFLSSGISNTNVTVNGTVRITAAVTGGSGITGGTAALFRFNNGSLYQHQRNGGGVPTATYNDGATISIEGIISNALLTISSGVYNGKIIYNCPSQSSAIAGTSAILLSNSLVCDSLEINNTGLGGLLLNTNPNTMQIGTLINSGGTLIMGTPNTNTNSNNIQINNQWKINGGTVTVSGTHSADASTKYPVTINLNGSFNMSSGNLILSDRSAGFGPTYAPGQINTKGDFLQTGGLITETSPVSDPTFVNYINLNNTSSNQNLSISNMTNEVKLQINNTFSSGGVYVQNNINLPFIGQIVNGNVVLANNNFTCNAGLFNYTNGAAKVITNGSGNLVLNNITTTAITFPLAYAIGSTYNPVAINNGSGANFGCRVENGINPPIGLPLNAINRTWHIEPNTILPVSPADLYFYYADADANPGCNPTAPMELGGYTSVWNMLSGSPATPTGTAALRQVQFSTNNWVQAYVVGNVNSILSVTNTIDFSVQKNASGALLQWTTTIPSSVQEYEIQKSTDGITYTSIGKVLGGSNHNYSFQDAFTTTSTKIYYKIRIKTINGNSLFSVVRILNYSKSNKPQLIPNIVTTTTTLYSTELIARTATLTIVNSKGQLVWSTYKKLQQGNNQIDLDVSHLSAGVYYLNIGDSIGNTLKFIKQ